MKAPVPKRPSSSHRRIPSKRVSVASNRSPSAPRHRGPKPPSTFGDSDSNLGDPSSPKSKHKDIAKMDPSEQRKVSKKYLDNKLIEIKDKYKS